MGGRRTWRWMGFLWFMVGSILTIAMLYLGVATLVDLGWRGRAIGAFTVAGVGLAMTWLGLWTLRAEFVRPRTTQESGGDSRAA